MPNFKTITKKEESAKVYLQILAMATAASDNIQLVPYHEDEKTNTIHVRLMGEKHTIDRAIILNQHPTAASLMTILNVVYDLLEIDRGNKPHYVKGSNQTHEQQIEAEIFDVDAYMEEFKKLHRCATLEEFGDKVDHNMADRELQGRIATALGASRKRVTETVISGKNKK